MAGEAERLLAVGLSHRTAPVEVRERVAMDDQTVRSFLSRLHSEQVVSEALVLSTCNRMELYSVPHSIDRVRAAIHEFRGPSGDSLDPYLYWYKGRDAICHLFRVASSLDSLVLGEPQILGQVKTAVRLAQETSSLGRVLRPLAQRSLSVAKRVRTETDLGRARVGIGNAGVDLALQIFGSLQGKRAMLLGVGEMGRQVARALISAGLDELIVANRTYERSVELATAHSFTPIPWERVTEYLPRADIVIAATGARQPVVTAEMVRKGLRARRFHTVFLIDLAVPRNIAPDVGGIEDAYLFNIDDLTRVVQEGKAAREVAAQAADLVVQQEADRFLQTLAVVDVKEDIRHIAGRIEQLRLAEIERSSKLTRGLDARQLKSLDALTRALVKKILHGPMGSLRTAARNGDAARVEALMEQWKE